MRAVSRLSTNSLAGRRSRTALLIVAVAVFNIVSALVMLPAVPGVARFFRRRSSAV